MAQNDKILVVEDDPTLCELLRLNLELEGYDVDTASSAEEALLRPAQTYALILLDVMMKEMSGFAYARHLKNDPATAAVPIIFCTARDNEDDMVAGLNIGADDYITKPYTMRMVLTRVKTVLRRTRIAAPEATETMKVGGIVLDLKFKRCFVDDMEVKLVKKEFEVLLLLMKHAGTILSREKILKAVWEDNDNVFDRTVDVNITRIRQKINPYGHRIITRPGYGYGFE